MEKKENPSRSHYTEEKATLFCDRIAGGRTVRSVCADEDMPTAKTVYTWLNENESFLKQYARAKELHADAMADQILEIADTADADNVCDEFGNIKPNHEWIARSKLRVDSRKWLLSKIMPRKYGDKVEQTLVGDPARPIHNMNENLDVSTMTNQERREFIHRACQGSEDV